MTYKQVTELIGTTAVEATKFRYMEQGHSLTGKSAASIRDEVTMRGNDTVITIYSNNTVYYLNRGVPYNKIPYTQGSGAKTSKFIDGLQAYAKLRFGLSDKEALSVAFQIARKAVKPGGGLPSEESKKFSKTGKRTGFVNDAILDVVKELTPKMGRLIFQSISQKQIEGR